MCTKVAVKHQSSSSIYLTGSLWLHCQRIVEKITQIPVLADVYKTTFYLKPFFSKVSSKQIILTPLM